MNIFIILTAIHCLSLIIPKTHINHRLTYKNGPEIINSAITDNERGKDYFELPDEYTYLNNSDSSMCYKESLGLYTCPKSIGSKVWKFDYIYRETRFRDPYGMCLTVDIHHKDDDSYSLNLKECKEEDENQIFILSKEHGNIRSKVTGKSIISLSKEEKEDFENRNRKFKSK